MVLVKIKIKEDTMERTIKEILYRMLYDATGCCVYKLEAFIIRAKIGDLTEEESVWLEELRQRLDSACQVRDFLVWAQRETAHSIYALELEHRYFEED